MAMANGQYKSSQQVADDDALEVGQILEDCYNSKKRFAQLMFPERFFRPFSPIIHDPIFDVLRDKTKQRIVVIAPRGVGKTSLINLVEPAHAICFREYRFIVPIGASARHAMMQSENLKRKLLTNPTIIKLFGSIRLQRPRQVDQFSKEFWITEAEGDWPGAKVLPRGSGQTIRGFIVGDDRPDLILVDDLEDPQDLLSEELRAKQRDWFFGSVCGAPDLSKPHRIIVLGSLLHEDSLIARLADDPGWETVRLELCDENGKSNWPEYLPDKKITELVDGFRRQEKLDIFYREYRGILVPTQDASFQQRYFKYHDETELDLNNNPDVENFILVDPGRLTRGLSAADTAIVGVGVNSTINAFYFRDCVAGKFHLDQMWDEIFGMAERIAARIAGVEITGLHEFIIHPFQSEVIRRGSNLQLEELTAKRTFSKEDRIRALVPYYRQGRVWHNKSACMRLEEQLLSFPYSKKSDIMDAFAYIIPLLEKGRRYFSFESKAEDKKEGREAIEAEYEDIYKEYEPRLSTSHVR